MVLHLTIMQKRLLVLITDILNILQENLLFNRDTQPISRDHVVNIYINFQKLTCIGIWAVPKFVLNERKVIFL